LGKTIPSPIYNIRSLFDISISSTFLRGLRSLLQAANFRHGTYHKRSDRHQIPCKPYDIRTVSQRWLGWPLGNDSLAYPLEMEYYKRLQSPSPVCLLTLIVHLPVLIGVTTPADIRRPAPSSRSSCYCLSNLHQRCRGGLVLALSQSINTVGVKPDRSVPRILMLAFDVLGVMEAPLINT
jgi:hypothetical protein